MASRSLQIGVLVFLLSGSYTLQGQELEVLPVPQCGMVSYFHALGGHFDLSQEALPYQSKGKLDFYLFLSKSGAVQEVRLKHKAPVPAEFLENFAEALRKAPSWLPGKNYKGEEQDSWVCFSVQWECYGNKIRFIPVHYPPRPGAEAYLHPFKE